MYIHRERENMMVHQMPTMAESGQFQSLEPGTSIWVSHVGEVTQLLRPSWLPPRVCISTEMESGAQAVNQSQIF